MAIYTLPNGSTWNTGLPYNEQSTGSYEFIDQVERANTPVKTFISGQNPNLPRVTSQTWTETSYDTYNYISKETYTYKDNSYTKQNVVDTFEIENK